ncbi:MAG: hypothetical protein L6R40_008718 [Gallowayella cf. fulva]|nr:MAG: hypothetical protein L6R40_008718 [Xanthomendoza cf. fulva]
MHKLLLSVLLSLLISLSIQTNPTDAQPNHALEGREVESTYLYVIYPKDVTVKSQADAINETLHRYVMNKTEIYASELNMNNMWTLFWNAPLTQSQADSIKKDPNVGSIAKSSTSFDPLMSYSDTTSYTMQKRNTGLTRQRNAVDEMRLLSQPIDLNDFDHYLRYFKDYVYDGSAGSGVTVYISDTGANLANPEFTHGSNIASRARWLFGQGGGIVNTDETDISVKGHGSCMLDKIGGNKYGVAKRVNPVIARASHSSAEAFLDTVRQITADYQQIYTQDPTHARAILNLSWGYPPNELGEGKDSWINEMRALLQGLISKGVTVIVPSGNKYANQFRQPIDSYPQLFAGESGNNGIPELLVVGGIHVYDGKYGQLWERSATADYVQVYAPSFAINCADGSGGLRNPAETTGVSMAAAQVSGMAAYFLGLSSLSDYLHDDDGRARVVKLKDFIIRAAWDRTDPDGLLKAIYNHEDPRTCPANQKRDGDEVGEPCRSSPTTSAVGNDITAMVPTCLMIQSTAEVLLAGALYHPAKPVLLSRNVSALVVR